MRKKGDTQELGMWIIPLVFPPITDALAMVLSARMDMEPDAIHVAWC
jgi:hypothetical protein